jgi:hypothetical protein
LDGMRCLAWDEFREIDRVFPVLSCIHEIWSQRGEQG